MAIKSTTQVYGVIVQDVYTKAICPAVTEDKTHVVFFANSSVNGEPISVVERQHTCGYVTGENPYSAAYAYLKSLAEFYNSVDV